MKYTYSVRIVLHHNILASVIYFLQIYHSSSGRLCKSWFCLYLAYVDPLQPCDPNRLRPLQTHASLIHQLHVVPQMRKFYGRLDFWNAVYSLRLALSLMISLGDSLEAALPWSMTFLPIGVRLPFLSYI
jgi:hypothetical protein